MPPMVSTDHMLETRTIYSSQGRVAGYRKASGIRLKNNTETKWHTKALNKYRRDSLFLRAFLYAKIPLRLSHHY